MGTLIQVQHLPPVSSGCRSIPPPKIWRYIFSTKLGHYSFKVRDANSSALPLRKRANARPPPVCDMPKHNCNWPGCHVKVDAQYWGCRQHWYRIPERLRKAIWMEYRHGQEIVHAPTAEYLKVATEVQDWIAGCLEKVKA